MKATYSRKNKRPGKNKNQIKIMGGRWKGRKLNFADRPDLRPTLSRTKETLFNWLRPNIMGAKCIDLFAGSGSLGFEALSQGASEVTIIESDRKTFELLKENSNRLNAGAALHHGDAIEFLNRTNESYDIAFLDPPLLHARFNRFGHSANSTKKLDNQFPLYRDDGFREAINNCREEPSNSHKIFSKRKCALRTLSN